ncbi:MAG: GNAT family N-acetyltransferase [Alphaproteobacteria bacterium]|nr:GNAT family N-acetyltransferase [Alphaproteobacteria bacterium]
MENGPYDLKNPASRGEWQTYHRIRREVLFEASGLARTYDEDDESALPPGAQALLLFHDGRAVATLRLSLLSERSMEVRLVAVAQPDQGRGHGRVLLGLAETRAREAGAWRMVVNVFGGAEPFFAKSGYVRETWDDPIAGPPAPEVIQMAKEL